MGSLQPGKIRLAWIRRCVCKESRSKWARHFRSSATIACLPWSRGTTYRSPTSLLFSEDEGGLPLSVKHWNAGNEATGQIVGRGVFPGIQQSSQDRGWPSSFEVHQVQTVGEHLQTLALQPAPVAKPPPSISDLDRPRRPPALPAPPLPRFAASSGSRRTIQLMVDGLQREGYLDDQGFISTLT